MGDPPQWNARLAGVLDWGLEKFPVVNPATGIVIAQVSACRGQQALLAIEAACCVAPVWRQTSSGARRALLLKWAANLSRESERIAMAVTLETGKPIGEARKEVSEAVRSIERFSEHCELTEVSAVTERSGERRLERRLQPIGPIAAITNWCQPVLTSVRRIAPALAVGCPVILKPSARAPVSALTIADLWDDAGGPAGTLQVLTTDDPIAAIDAFLSDARVALVSFTGSIDVGRHVARKCADAGKEVLLEVDGQNPFIVLRDVDVTRVADAFVAGTFLRNAGQDCTSANRLYVDEQIADAFLRAVAARVAQLRCGDPLDPRTDMGPLIDSVALTILGEQIEDSVADGATVAIGGRRLGGRYFEPTVLDNVRPGMRVAEDARAGPLLPVFRFASTETVIGMVKAAGRGRSVRIWCKDNAAARRLADEIGYEDVWLNDDDDGYPDRAIAGGTRCEAAAVARYVRPWMLYSGPHV